MKYAQSSVLSLSLWCYYIHVFQVAIKLQICSIHYVWPMAVTYAYNMCNIFQISSILYVWAMAVTYAYNICVYAHLLNPVVLIIFTE